MLVAFSPIFMGDTMLIYGYNFVASLAKIFLVESLLIDKLVIHIYL